MLFAVFTETYIYLLRRPIIMAQIRMTPEELRDAASTLLSKREEILSAVGVIETTINNTTSNWEGAAQSSFVQSFEEMLPTLKETFPEIIEGIESQLKGAADALEQADQEIANAFKG
jgi:WXG100 family type VII secretion target